MFCSDWSQFIAVLELILRKGMFKFIQLQTVSEYKKSPHRATLSVSQFLHKSAENCGNRDLIIDHNAQVPFNPIPNIAGIADKSIMHFIDQIYTLYIGPTVEDHTHNEF